VRTGQPARDPVLRDAAALFDGGGVGALTEEGVIRGALAVDREMTLSFVRSID
jgi:hypothetical protein